MWIWTNDETNEKLSISNLYWIKQTHNKQHITVGIKSSYTLGVQGIKTIPLIKLITIIQQLIHLRNMGHISKI